MTTRFELRRPVKATDNLIYLISNYTGNRFSYSTGRKIDLKEWDIKNQYPKKTKLTTEVRQRLDTLQSSYCDLFVDLQRQKESITNEKLKDGLNNYFNMTTAKDKISVITHLEAFIASSTNIRKESTIKKFKTLKSHLEAFIIDKRFALTFEKIDFKFYHLFSDYLTNDKGLQNNSVSKYIIGLKTFLNWCADRGLNKYNHYKKFVTTETEQSIVHLTKEELTTLFNYELKSERLSKVKDLFVFGCFTGLRFGDLQQVCEQRIKDNVLTIHANKTEDTLNIHLTKQALSILEKYDYQLPRITNQKANLYIKEICTLVGIDTPVELIEKRGAKTIKKLYPKNEVISFHASRKTFVTLSLEAEIPVSVIMKQTGHKQTKVFNRYLNVTDKLKEAQFAKLENLIK